MGKGSGSGSGSGGYYLRGGHATPPPNNTSVEPSFSASDIATITGTNKSNLRPKGLQNVGNTCYANAALHCLLSTALTNALLDPTAATIFRRYSSNSNLLKQHLEDDDDGGDDDEQEDDDDDELQSHDKRKSRRRERENRKMQENCQWLTRELRILTREYHEDHTVESSSWFATYPNQVVDPGSITKHPNRLSKCLRPYQQEDAHEFLRALLSTLVMNGHNKQLSSLFDGLLESAVTCATCRTPSLTRDRYMDLSLDILSPQIKTLQQALQEFTKTETLTGDNKVFCQKCDAKRTATKGLRLATAPSILVCHLKRFAFDEYGRLIRLKKRVKFPLRLEIGSFMSRFNKARPPPYELVAVLVHQGNSCDSGHYLAYVKYQGEWFLCNDSIVEKVDVQTVLKQQAYILMYEVAEMREKNGFYSPSKSSSRKSSSAYRRSSEPPSSFISSMLCGLDDALWKDFCVECTGFGGSSSDVDDDDVVVHGKNKSYRGDWHESPHDDLSTLGESTVSSQESRRFQRSSSSGKILEKMSKTKYGYRHESSSAPRSTRLPFGVDEDLRMAVQTKWTSNTRISVSRPMTKSRQKLPRHEEGSKKSHRRIRSTPNVPQT